MRGFVIFLGLLIMLGGGAVAGAQYAPIDLSTLQFLDQVPGARDFLTTRMAVYAGGGAAAFGFLLIVIASLAGGKGKHREVAVVKPPSMARETTRPAKPKLAAAAAAVPPAEPAPAPQPVAAAPRPAPQPVPPVKPRPVAPPAAAAAAQPAPRPAAAPARPAAPTPKAAPPQAPQPVNGAQPAARPAPRPAPPAAAAQAPTPPPPAAARPAPPRPAPAQQAAAQPAIQRPPPPVPPTVAAQPAPQPARAKPQASAQPPGAAPAAATGAPPPDARLVNRKRVQDLVTINDAIKAYYAKTGAFPKADKVAGANERGAAWIPGLSPDFLKELPRDPMHGPATQYVYVSDGTNYKLLAQGVSLVGSANVEVLGIKFDKSRNPTQENAAFGFWTLGYATV